MASALTIRREHLDGYPFAEGAHPLELLQLFKRRFPERADLAKIQESILLMDAVYCESVRAARLHEQWDVACCLRLALERNLEKGTNEVADAFRKAVELELKLLDAESRQTVFAESVDKQAATAARHNLTLMAVELCAMRVGRVALREGKGNSRIKG